MNIGTGKPSFLIQDKVPHYGLDLVEPDEEFHAARYVELVAPHVREILARKHVPIFVGGSGLYFRALFTGLSPDPGQDPEIRSRLIEEAQHSGVAALYCRLQEVDPVSAERIHLNDLRRIVRALEVFCATGKPLSSWHEKTTPAVSSDHGPRYFFALTCEREWLARRIKLRGEEWLTQGWLEEARQLAAQKLSRTAQEALGYKELFAYLRGEMDWETTLETIQMNTRRYAKRQWTWFRKEKNLEWIDVTDKNPDEAAHIILKKVKT